jgi:GT2 family glycosyltransferase
VTIVVCALDEGTALAETIESIHASYDLPREIVVVDDGSADGCCDRLPEDPRAQRTDLKLVTQARVGVAGARNVGASLATQPYLVFLDAHCLVHPGWLADLVKVMAANPGSLVGPAVGDRDEPDAIGCGAKLVGCDLRYRWNPVRGQNPIEVGIIPGGCLGVSRALFGTLGGFDAMRHFGFEDVEFCLRAWRLGARLLGVPVSRIDHRFRGGHPFEVPRSSFVYNAVRTAILHLDGERLKATLTSWSRHPDFTHQMIDLISGDVLHRKSAINSQACPRHPGLLCSIRVMVHTGIDQAEPGAGSHK